MMVPARIQTVIDEVAREHAIHPLQYAKRGVSKKPLLAMRATIRRMSDMGLNPSTISRYLGKERTTVLYHLGLTRRGAEAHRQKLSWHQPRVKHLNCNCDWCHPNRHLERPVVKVVQQMSRAHRKRFLVPYAGFDPDQYVWKEIKAPPQVVRKEACQPA